MNLKVLKLTGFFGIIAPLFGLMIIGMAIWLSPWFSWTANALSDLGGTDGFESVVFNSGLAMTAALLLMYGAGLLELAKGDLIGQVGAGINLLSSVFLLAIGFVNVTVEPWHYYVSVGFFTTLPLSALFVGYFLYRKNLRLYTLLSWGSAILSICIWLLQWGSPAIPEALSVGYMAVWVIIIGYWMYTRKSEKVFE
jgi:hypothetical membrane protein